MENNNYFGTPRLSFFIIRFNWMGRGAVASPAGLEVM